MASRYRMRRRRPSPELALIGAALAIPGLLLLTGAALGFQGIPTHHDPAGLAMMVALIATIGAGVLAFGLYAIVTGIRGEAR